MRKAIYAGAVLSISLIDDALLLLLSLAGVRLHMLDPITNALGPVGTFIIFAAFTVASTYLVINKLLRHKDESPEV